jgi:hypothetical protein
MPATTRPNYEAWFAFQQFKRFVVVNYVEGKVAMPRKRVLAAELIDRFLNVHPEHCESRSYLLKFRGMNRPNSLYYVKP